MTARARKEKNYACECIFMLILKYEYLLISMTSKTYGNTSNTFKVKGNCNVYSHFLCYQELA